MSPEPIHVVRPFLPPLAEYVQELESIWETHHLTHSGPKHQALTAALADYLSVPQVSLFANGHLALEAALQTLGVTGEVITTPFTFASTTQAIVHSGATPVFCDITADSYVMDPELIESLITDRTSAILPVHVYGNLCDHARIQEIADAHGLKVIYDAAHAFGVTKDGIGVGSYGDVSMFSFHATKVFHTIEGGGLTFADERLSQEFAAWRQFGQYGKEDSGAIGTNAKLTEFGAAMGLVNLRHIDATIEARRQLTLRYREHLASVPGLSLGEDIPGIRHNYAYLPVVFDPEEFGRSRDDVLRDLADNDIYARRYFHPLTSQFSVFEGRFPAEQTPVAAGIADRVLTLPLYAGLPASEVDRICEVVLAGR
ncbi:MAG: DegT/DnrJ/EryC1/StrS family aminotransferase [Actinobacteria bacterium]|nr:DegT/DnrJ/EryC1/StrS family aminotransferase [Actinomycetota bacterium]